MDVRESFMANLITEICKKNNLNLVLGPKLGKTGRIEHKQKVTSFFNCCFDVNGYGSSLIARNKGLTRLCLEENSIPMAKGMYFSKDIDEYKELSNDRFISVIMKKIENIRLPVMVKGADLHRGSCIYKACTKGELYSGINKVLKKTNEIVIEEYIELNVYRILIYKGELIAAYGKEPFGIVGNGEDTIENLIKKESFDRNVNSIGMNLNSMLEEISKKLDSKNYNMDTILEKNKKIILTDVANVSKGAEVRDVTEIVPDEIKKMCLKISKVMNLNLCGIDIISKKFNDMLNDTYVLEVNSSPCLETYSKIGKKQSEKIYKLMENIILDSIK